MTEFLNFLREYFRDPKSQEQFIQSCTNIATIFPPLIAAIAFSYTKIKKWNDSAKNKINLDLIQKINLNNGANVDKLINSEIFRMLTGKNESIKVINQIHNCFDPHAALQLYSKNTWLVRFNELGYPIRPNYFKIWHIFIVSQILLCMSLFAMNYFVFRIITLSKYISYDSYFKLIFIFSIFTILPYMICGFYWSEIRTLKSANYFYKNFSIYFREKYQNKFDIISYNKDKLIFKEHEYIEFYSPEINQILTGKIIKIDSEVNNTFIHEMALVKLSLGSFITKKSILLKKLTIKLFFKLKYLNRLSPASLSMVVVWKKMIHFLAFVVKESSFIEKHDLNELNYPNDLMKWSISQYKILLFFKK
jgi:hypothetical protein